MRPGGANLQGWFCNLASNLSKSASTLHLIILTFSSCAYLADMAERRKFND